MSTTFAPQQSVEPPLPRQFVVPSSSSSSKHGAKQRGMSPGLRLRYRNGTRRSGNNNSNSGQVRFNQHNYGSSGSSQSSRNRSTHRYDLQRRPTQFPYFPQHDQHYYEQHQQPQAQPQQSQQQQQQRQQRTDSSQQRANLKSMLRRKNSSLYRAGSGSPRPGSLRGLPYTQVPQVPMGQQSSPVMLVRKRTSANSIRGSPIRRFFRKLFKRRTKSRIKYFFNKDQLKRQLSFEIRESPSKSVKYEVKSMQLMNPKAKVKRQESKTYSQPEILSPKPTHPKSSPLLRQQQNQAPSDMEQEFREFDFDYRDRSKAAATPRVRDAQTQTAQVSRQATFQRKRSMVNRNTSAKSNSNMPLIRRVDLYDNPDPAVQMEHEDEVDVDEALAFVQTWSSYLRRAVAVRVVLRQEIHSLEEQEEKEWEEKQKGEQRRSLSTTSSSSSLYSDTSSVSSATTHSSFSNSGYDSTTKESETSSANHGDQSSLGYTHSMSSGTSSTFDNLPKPVPGYKKVNPQQRVHDIRESLEQGRMYQKYSSLVSRPQSYHPYASPSLSQPSPPPHGNDSSLILSKPSPQAKQARVVSESVKPTRSSTDSFSSLAKPDRESNWMAPKRASIRVARPLPEIPKEQKGTRSVSVPAYMLQKQQDQQHFYQSPSPSPPPPPVPPKDHVQRNMSDQILHDMYHELEELQQRSAQLSDLVKHNVRDSAIETNSRRNSTMSTNSQHSNSSTSSSGTELSRGRVNRKRRPRSKVYVDKRASVIETPWTVRSGGVGDDDDDDNADDAKSEDSGITFDGSPTQWRSSLGKHPLLIEVGETSRPPSASETRFI